MAGLKDMVSGLLASADKRNGFPVGTMQALMQQETGGQDKYLVDPSTYHYGLNASDKRIAGHTGKVSTAFGPFGILESTAAKPGYGVQPLKDKSLEEQVRFASDYLAARSKQAGGLEAGLSGYGEGPAYGKQVMGRLGKVPVQQAPVVVAQAAVPATPPARATQVQAPVQVAAPAPVEVAQAPAAPGYGEDPWYLFNQAMASNAAPSVEATQFGMGGAVGTPNFLDMVQYENANQGPMFKAFGGLKGRG